MPGDEKTWIPLVSVIINCYNGEKYLNEAIDSIFVQTYKNWEIVFWDNCSTDGSASIAKSYGEKVRYFRGDSTVSLGAARNFAMHEVNGDLVGFLDCDDLWLPHKLERQVEAMADGCALCYGGNVLIDVDGNKIGEESPKPESGQLFERLLYQFDINVPSVMINKHELDSSGLSFDSNVQASEEYCLFMQFAVERKFVCLGETLAKYRIHDGALTGKAISRWAVEREYTLNRIIERYPGIERRYPKAFRAARARGSYYRARYLVHEGKKDAARRELFPLFGVDLRYCILWLVLWFPISVWNRIHERKTKRTEKKKT